PRRAYDIPSVRADAVNRICDLQWSARSLPKTQGRLSRSRRRLFALLDGALRRKISPQKIGNGTAQDAAKRVSQNPSLLLHVRERGVISAAGYRTIRRRIQYVCLRIAAQGHGMAAQS